MNYKWIKKDLDKEHVKDLVQKYDISPLMASVLIRRGIAESDYPYYLDNKELYTFNPFLLTDMDRACERILEAIYDEELVALFGDRDTDGLTGETSLALFFAKRKLHIKTLMPMGDDAYGLQKSLIEQLSSEGVTLIICIDNGSSSFEEVELAKELGIDVIIFDHHDLRDKKPDVYAFVNPKQDDSYPNKNLCASAVVSKALFALNYLESGFDEHLSILLNVYINDKNEYKADLCRLYRLQMGSIKSFNLNNSGDVAQFLDFVRGALIYTWQGVEQTKLLESIFNADVALEDLSTLLSASLGEYKHLPIKELAKISSFAKYQVIDNDLSLIFQFYRLWVFGQKDIFADYYNSLDLATIGLVGDIMELSSENRILAKIGLRMLSRPEKTSMKYLLRHLNLLGDEITTRSIGWKISPFINAAGRMGQPNKIVEFFLADNNDTALKLLAELEELSIQRKKISEEWWHKIQDSIYKSKERYDNKIIFICEKDLPRGLTGLIASRISRTIKEAMVVVLVERADGHYVASVRCAVTGRIEQFLDQNKDNFVGYGGHDKAAGFTVLPAFVKELPAVFNKLAKSWQNTVVSEEKIYIDAELSLRHMDEHLLAMIKKLEPYGDGFNTLVFATKGVILKQKNIIGKMNEHTKLTLELEGSAVNALWWDSVSKYDTLTLNQSYDVLYRIVIDEKKTTGFSIEIIDIRLCK